jgi:FkbM family methyltransferase
MDEHLDQRAIPDAPLAQAPWYFRFARFLERRSIRGGARLLREARKRGLLDRLAVYSLGQIQLRVPLWRPCNAWTEDDVREYEARLMDAIAQTIHGWSDVTLVDCGADIGTISAHLVSRCPNISTVVAFEPNAAAYHVLAENLRNMNLRANARHAAVGSFNGQGKLVQSPLDPSAHAMFIEPAMDGDIAVQRIDDLDLPAGSSVLIKIDVEGSEAAVVEGALRTIRDAGAVVVAFEAHPRVTRRTGEDPVRVMRALRSVRPDMTFVVDTVPIQPLGDDRPLFEQLPPDRVYNVIASSRRR